MGKKNRFGIRPKIMIGYLVIIICLVIVFITLNRQVTSLQAQRNHMISHEMEVHNLASKVEKYVIDMETGQRGYLITGMDSYLTPYNEAVKNWEGVFFDLKDLVREDPEQAERLDEIKTTVDNWIKTTGNAGIVLKQQGDEKAVEKFLKDDIGKADMDKRRRQFDAFRVSEQEMTKNQMVVLDKRNKVLTIELFGILIVLAATAIAIASATARLISNTLKSVTDTIKGIATSEEHLQKRIHVRTNDEIRDLSDATNELLDTMDQREWQQQNTAEILKATQGLSSIQKLAEKFLNKLAASTKAELGAFYVREESSNGVFYVKKAAYADPHGEAGRSKFRPGEGLIGQCAEKQELKIIQNVPDDYRPITSGLGQVVPKSLLIVPIVYEGTTIAVIELGAVQPFSSQHEELIEGFKDTFGLTVNSVLSRMEVVRLLRESQTMTEELQAQHEELQTQSEELRMQSEELQTTNDQLEDRTKEAELKAKEVELARKELEQKNGELELSSNYKSEFLANMSHELRTPLNSILILSEMLSENGDPSSEESEYARIIQSSGKDLLNLINDILDLSKVEAGKIEIVIDELNLGDFAEQTNLKFTHMASQKGLDFTVLAEDIPNLFYTDAGRFQQIAKNLVSNAIKFTEAGTVTMKLHELEPEQLTPEMGRVSEQWVALSVADTGIGIPEDKHQLIFEAFQQADGATSRKYGGTGLGLSICSEFTKLLGGTIFLDSKEGEGSIFTVVLPSLPEGLKEDMMFARKETYQEVAASLIEQSAILIQPKPVLQSEEPKPKQDVFLKKHVLIVDDDQRNIFALRQVLEKQGMDVLEARDGKECIELMKQRQDIDLVLMDIMMPQMDGYEAMRTIRNELKLQELPIIALTAKAMKQDREKCLEAGASDYISKPLVMEQLLSAMRVWLAPKAEVH